jgi:hypothetical protein
MGLQVIVDRICVVHTFRDHASCYAPFVIGFSVLALENSGYLRIAAFKFALGVLDAEFLRDELLQPMPGRHAYIAACPRA